MHDSPLGGHLGYLKTLHRGKQDIFWKGMKSDVKSHIKCCEMCQRIKVDTSKPVGLLLPLPIPVKPWVDISMDFVEGLPKSMGYEVVFFVVDRLIKYVHFLPLSHPFTTTKVASVFMKEIFRSHGMQLLLLSYGRSCLDYKALT